MVGREKKDKGKGKDVRDMTGRNNWRKEKAKIQYPPRETAQTFVDVSAGRPLFFQFPSA